MTPEPLDLTCPVCDDEVERVAPKIRELREDTPAIPVAEATTSMVGDPLPRFETIQITVLDPCGHKFEATDWDEFVKALNEYNDIVWFLRGSMGTPLGRVPPVVEQLCHDHLTDLDIRVGRLAERCRQNEWKE